MQLTHIFFQLSMCLILLMHCLTEGLQCVLDFVTVNIISFSDRKTNIERITSPMGLNYVLPTSFLRCVEVLTLGAFGCDLL